MRRALAVGLRPVRRMSEAKRARVEEGPGELSEKERRSQRLIWIDCEMTGLDVEREVLLEVAAVVTEGDRSLSVVEESPGVVIHRSEELMAAMGPWCRKTFAKNGLADDVRASSTSVAEAEKLILDMVRRHTEKGVCPLAGNTVSADRRFLEKEMPDLAAHLHYRTVDVSSLKELAKRWIPQTLRDHPRAKDKADSSHRALDDIRDSINELRYYQEHFIL